MATPTADGGAEDAAFEEAAVVEASASREVSTDAPGESLGEAGDATMDTSDAGYVDVAVLEAAPLDANPEPDARGLDDVSADTAVEAAGDRDGGADSGD